MGVKIRHMIKDIITCRDGGLGWRPWTPGRYALYPAKSESMESGMDRLHMRFGGQSVEEAEANLTLAALIRNRRGDPLLGAWEEGFLADIEKLLRSNGGYVTLTDKQFDRVFVIFEQLDAMVTTPTACPMETEADGYDKESALG